MKVEDVFTDKPENAKIASRLVRAIDHETDLLFVQLEDLEDKELLTMVPERIGSNALALLSDRVRERIVIVKTATRGGLANKWMIEVHTGDPRVKDKVDRIAKQLDSLFDRKVQALERIRGYGRNDPPGKSNKFI